MNWLSPTHGCCKVYVSNFKKPSMTFFLQFSLERLQTLLARFTLNCKASTNEFAHRANLRMAETLRTRQVKQARSKTNHSGEHKQIKMPSNPQGALRSPSRRLLARAPERLWQKKLALTVSLFK